VTVCAALANLYRPIEKHCWLLSAGDNEIGQMTLVLVGLIPFDMSVIGVRFDRFSSGFARETGKIDD
jgi:hypothetical protein